MLVQGERSTLSNEELNKKLSVLLGLAKNGKVLSFYQKPRYDFCGNWSLLMPYIVKHEILESYCFYKEKDGCHMHSGKGSKFHVIANEPQRALADSLLKHLQINDQQS